MVHNIAIESFIFPCPDHTDVHERANWTYHLHVVPTIGPTPMNIPQNVNVGGDIDDECDHRERGSPAHRSPYIYVPHAHTAPNFTNTLAGTSYRGGQFEELLHELRERRVAD